jgi:two-component system phosphate regulon sensor histidine kinase PhoR
MPDSNPKIEARIAVSGKDEVLIIMRDITDRARLEQLKTDFINRASHELRTPLTTATMMVELIQEGGTPEEIKEYWQILHNELNRQRQLIDRLLTAGRLESNTLLISPAPVEIVPIVEEAISALVPIARKKGLPIQKAFKEPLPPVIGESMGLQQVLINLLSNAVKYTPGDESVLVAVYPHDGGVNVEISDRGIGIPEEDLPNLFERFFRARNVTLAEIPGSGIGLYIVKSIVEELEGKVSVRNNPDKGTTFSVWLRRAEEDE